MKKPLVETLTQLPGEGVRVDWLAQPAAHPYPKERKR